MGVLKRITRTATHARAISVRRNKKFRAIRAAQVKDAWIRNQQLEIAMKATQAGAS